jgi:hypothetical protein
MTNSNLVVSVLVEDFTLPRKWQAWKSPSGKLFYWNPIYKRFTWEKPKVV